MLALIVSASCDRRAHMCAGAGPQHNSKDKTTLADKGIDINDDLVVSLAKYIKWLESTKADNTHSHAPNTS